MFSLMTLTQRKPLPMQLDSLKRSLLVHLITCGGLDL